VVAVTLAMSGCATSGRSRSLRRVPTCQPLSTLRPPAEWQRVDLGDGFAFFLPSSCVPDPETPQFVHGGSRWRCGTVGVDVVWGMWGPGSFSDHEQQCRTTLSRLPALVSVRIDGEEHRRIVWYLTGGIHEPLVSAWSSVAADVPQLQAIGTSGLFSGSRGPNR
jgi:hypothetical protein